MFLTVIVAFQVALARGGQDIRTLDNKAERLLEKVGEIAKANKEHADEVETLLGDLREEADDHAEETGEAFRKALEPLTREIRDLNQTLKNDVSGQITNIGVLIASLLVGVRQTKYGALLGDRRRRPRNGSDGGEF